MRTLDVSRHLESIKIQKIEASGRDVSESDRTLYQPLSYQEAIYLATLGGAEALSLGHITGNFSVGKQFDALIVEASPMIRILSEIQPAKVAARRLQDLVERFIYVGDDRNIVQVFVSGKRIK